MQTIEPCVENVKATKLTWGYSVNFATGIPIYETQYIVRCSRIIVCKVQRARNETCSLPRRPYVTWNSQDIVEESSSSRLSATAAISIRRRQRKFVVRWNKSPATINLERKLRRNRTERFFRNPSKRSLRHENRSEVFVVNLHPVASSRWFFHGLHAKCVSVGKGESFG